MSKLNERLTLVANLSVVAGIAFLAVELHQNTQAIHGQTRDSITEKQMTYYGWIGLDRDAADVFQRGNTAGISGLEGAEQQMYRMLVAGILREFENSHYQYEQGLFDSGEFRARVVRWERMMRFQGWRDAWEDERETFAPAFRAEIDRIVAEADQVG
jgi:hypothetical protein